MATAPPAPGGSDHDLPAEGDLFELAPVALSLISLDGRQLRGNAAYRRLFGLSTDRLGQVDAFAITHPSELERTRSYLQELADGTRDRVTEEKLYVGADGTAFTGRLTATRMCGRDGRPVALLGVIEDVTVESAQRTEIDLAHRRLRAMLENISDTVTLIDAEGRVMDTTGLHTAVMDYEPSFWEGRSLYDLTVPEDREALVAAHRRVLENPGLPVQEDLRVLHSDGTLRDLEVTAVNLLDDPAVGGIVITSRNITDRKRVEAELARHRDEAVEESRLRSELVARVSHELRNQLHAVRGLTELLSSADVPRSVRELADSAHRQAEQFSHLVDDLLEYSRMEAGREEARPTPALVRQIVADSAALGSRLARRGVRVLGRTAESVPDLVQVDDARVRQVLANLVSNAAKFTREGQVSIDLERGRMDGRPSLRFVVTDTGVGIDPADLDRIFRPFDQGSRGDPSEGTGLGLSITHNIISQHGGEITAASPGPGKGATFTVRLPVRPDPNPQPAIPPPSSETNRALVA
jgi:PAS domain S-box-containing protein